jgi:hypothetical protein
VSVIVPFIFDHANARAAALARTEDFIVALGVLSQHVDFRFLPIFSCLLFVISFR